MSTVHFFDVHPPVAGARQENEMTHAASLRCERRSKKSANLPLRLQQRTASILFAPRTLQCMAECLKRVVKITLQPDSTMLLVVHSPIA